METNETPEKRVNSPTEEVEVLRNLADYFYKVNDLPYHNIRHINDVVQKCKAIRGTPMSDTLYLAAIFHDVVHEQGSLLINEVQSARAFTAIRQVASVIMPNTKKSKAVDADVAGLIMVTAFHAKKVNEMEINEWLNVNDSRRSPTADLIMDAYALLDADLSAIGVGNYALFKIQNAYLREEGTTLESTIAVYKTLLEKEFIFYTPYGRENFERFTD